MTHAERRRASLLRAALELYVERGYHQTKVSDIVERAGVSQGTFYLYFGSKRDTFNALMDMWFAPFWELIARGDAQRPTSAAEADAIALSNVTALFHLYVDRPLLARLMFQYAESVGPDASARMEELRVRYAEYIERAYLRRLEAGINRPVNTQVWGHALVGLLERLAFRWFVMGQQPALSPEMLASEVMDIVFSGVRQRPVGTADILTPMCPLCAQPALRLAADEQGCN